MNGHDLYLYPDNSDTPATFKIDTEDISNATVDRECDCIYFTDFTDKELKKIDRTGKVSTLSLDRDITRFSNFNAEERTFCTEENTEDSPIGATQFICSFDDAKHISETTFAGTAIQAVLFCYCFSDISLNEITVVCSQKFTIYNLNY